MQAVPELKNVVFDFQRTSATTRAIRLNGTIWRQLTNAPDSPEVASLADWGPGGLRPDLIARDMLSVVFDPDTPGYGRIAGRVASDEAYTIASRGYPSSPYPPSHHSRRSGRPWSKGVT